MSTGRRHVTRSRSAGSQLQRMRRRVRIGPRSNRKASVRRLVSTGMRPTARLMESDATVSTRLTLELPSRDKSKAKFLYIVSREWPGLHRRIPAEFADLPSVMVILDRRVTAGTHVHDRRVLTIHEDLEALGWAIVQLA